MSFTDPTTFQIIGPNEDETGASQIAMAKAIGGAESIDGQDEATILLKNSHFLWSGHNRCQVNELTTYGEATPGSPWATTTSASYVEVGQALATLGGNRNDVVAKIDWVGRVKIEVYDTATDTLQDTQETASTSSQGQADLTIDAGSDTDVYYKIYLHKGGATTGQVWSVSFLEGSAGLDTHGGAGFKKIDTDAANGLEPFDAFLGQGIADNIEAAYTSRVRRAGAFWPTDKEPVLASVPLVAYPLSTWRISYGVDEIQITLRVTVQDASVAFGAAVYDFYNIGRLDTENIQYQTVTTGGPKQTTITLDATPYRGREVLLMLFVESFDSGTVQTKDYSSGNVNIIEDTHRVNLHSGHALTFAPGERYKLEIGDSPAGGNTPTFPTFPGAKTVVYQDGNELWVWPRYEAAQVNDDINRWYLSAYTATVTTIGSAKLHSLRIVESSTLDRPSLAARVHPGHLPSARNIGKPLYMRQRTLWQKRTRCHRAVGGYDPARLTGTDIKTKWGAFEAFADNGYEEMGACLIRGYDASKDDNGALQYRSRLRVHGILQCVSDYSFTAANGFDVDIRLKLSSWGGSAWDANEVVGDSITIQQAPVLLAWQGDPSLTRSGDLVSYKRGTNRGAYHHLEGAIDVSDLRAGTHGLIPFYLTITDTQTTATSRLLRIQFQGDAVDALGNGTYEVVQPGTNWMRLVCWSVWTEEHIAV